MAIDPIPPDLTKLSTSTKSGGKKYKYTGPNVYPSVKNDKGEEVGPYELYPTGEKLRPWLWSDEEIQKFMEANPDHMACKLFEKI